MVNASVIQDTKMSSVLLAPNILSSLGKNQTIKDKDSPPSDVGSSTDRSKSSVVQSTSSTLASTASTIASAQATLSSTPARIRNQCKSSGFNVKDIINSLHDVDDRLNRDVIIDYIFNENYTLDPQTQPPSQQVVIPTATVTTTSGPNSKVVVVWDSKSNSSSAYSNTNRILQFNDWHDGISDWEPNHAYPYLKTYANLLNKRKAKRNDIEFDEDLGLHLPSARYTQQPNQTNQQPNSTNANNPLRQVNNPVSNRLFMKELNKLATNSQQPRRQSSANLKRSTSNVIRDDYSNTSDLKDTTSFTDDMIVVNMKKQDLFDLSQLQLRSDDLDRTRILGNNNVSDLASAVQNPNQNIASINRNQSQNNRLNRLHYQLVHQQSDPTSITGYDLEESSLIQIQKLVPASGSSSNIVNSTKKHLFSNFSFEDTINETYSDATGELNGIVKPELSDANVKVYKKPPINALQVSSLNTSANSANSSQQQSRGFRISPASSSTGNNNNTNGNLNIIVTETSSSNSNGSSKHVSPQNVSSAEGPTETSNFASQSSICSNPSSKNTQYHQQNRNSQGKTNSNFLTIHNKHQMQQSPLQQLAVSVTPASIQASKPSNMNTFIAGNGINNNLDLTSLPPIISGKRINLPLGQHRRQFILRYVDAGSLNNNERFRSRKEQTLERAAGGKQAHRQDNTMGSNVIKATAKASVILNMNRNRIMSTCTNTHRDLLEIRASALLSNGASGSQLDRKSYSKSAKS